MTFNTRQFFDFWIWTLTVFMLASFQIFYNYSWGRYIFIVCTLLILLLSAFRNKGKLKLRLSYFYLGFSLFVIYVFISSLWSMDSSRTLSMVPTLLGIMVSTFILYVAFSNLSESFKLLVTAIIAAAFVIEIYTLIHYGFNSLLLATHGARLDNEYANVNSIAVFMSVGILFNLFVVLTKGFKIWNIFPFTAIVVLAAIQSRKAIVVLVLGVLALIIMRNNTKKTSLINRILKLLFLIIVFAVAGYLITKLPVFAGMNDRLDQMINAMTGNGKADTSSIVRNKLINIGLTWWAKYPIGGVGIDATRVVSRQYLYDDYYMHNNYVELLCGGGIIGFGLFYSMHTVLIRNFIKMRNKHRNIYILGMILLGVILISDFGRVTYYSKTVLFEIMMLFVFADSYKSTGEGLSDDW